MVNFARIVNGFKPLTIFATYVILDIDQGSKHASVSVFGLNLNICEFCDHRETNQFIFKTKHKDFIGMRDLSNFHFLFFIFGFWWNRRCIEKKKQRHRCTAQRSLERHQVKDGGIGYVPILENL